MSDLIRRDDVEKTIRKLCDVCGEDKKYNGIMCGACNLDSFIRVLDDIPSAEPERHRGEWIEDGHERGFSKCSKCGYIAVSVLSERHYNFCPNCGADTRGEK